MKIFLTLTSAALLAAPLSVQAAAVPKPAEKAEAARPVKAAGVWIDVRTPEEFNEGHLEGALNITVDEIAEKIKSVSPDKNAPVNLYCRSGRRAEAARQILQKEGYTRVSNHGGYEELLKKGLK